MKLKELVQKVDQILTDFKNRALPITSDLYFFSEDDARQLYTSLGCLDDQEIENFNKIYWDSGINASNWMEAEKAAAYCLLANCQTFEEKQQKLEWLKKLSDETTIICRRINRRPPPMKKKDKEWRFGTFNKFDFIQAYGYMYDSEEEAARDANDTSAICPVLVGLLQTEWQDCVVKEDRKNGIVIVSKHNGLFWHGAALALDGIMTNVATIINNELMKVKIARSKFGDALLKYKPFWGGTPNHYLSNTTDIQQYMLGMSCFFADEDRFPQDVYDFKTVNHDFMEVVKNAFEIIGNLDETQHDLARELYVNLLDNMRQMADFECHIIRQQQERYPVTKRFLKPKFNDSNLVYTAILADILWWLEANYERVMRIFYDYHRHYESPLVIGLDSFSKIEKYCTMAETAKNEAQPLC